MSGPIAAVLLDVGGTLWPDRPPAPDTGHAARVKRLSAALPAVPRARCADIVRALDVLPGQLEAALTQDTDALIGAAVRPLEPALDAHEITAIRAALCLPAINSLELFPGARGLLESIKRLGLTRVVLSNAVWRDGESYRRDFADFGVAGLIDAVISSVDVGFRKPHRAMFEAAVRATGSAAGRCVMVGNSERNDITPAVALGMRAIRVAIEEPSPEASAAHAVASSLDEVTGILRAWSATQTPPGSPQPP